MERPRDRVSPNGGLPKIVEVLRERRDGLEKDEQPRWRGRYAHQRSSDAAGALEERVQPLANSMLR